MVSKHLLLLLFVHFNYVPCNFNGFITTWILHKIIMFSYKVKLVASKNNDLLHPLLSYWIYKFTNGGSYIGEWRIGKRHGRGLYKSAKGDLYYGKWIDDVRECGNDLRIVLQVSILSKCDLIDIHACLITHLNQLGWLWPKAQFDSTRRQQIFRDI